MANILVGILVDVSASMTSSIGDVSGSATRLDSVRSSIQKLVASMADTTAIDQSTIRVFILGFGFGNPLSSFFGRKGAPVRSLLSTGSGESIAVAAGELYRNWSYHEQGMRQLALEMFGSTPMKQALEEAEKNFWTTPASSRWLLIISDGAPTDGTPKEITTAVQRLRRDHVHVVACFLAASDVVAHRRLYAKADQRWSNEARLMFDCGSILDQSMPLHSYFKEAGWEVDDSARLFAQANNSALVSELIGAFSALAKSGGSSASPASADVPQSTERHDVFISYARADHDMARELAQHLSAAGCVVWWDQDIRCGDRFDDVIQEKLSTSTAVVVLWTPNSITSDWVKYEAKSAHDQGKLVPVKVPSLMAEDVPPPYPAILQIANLDDIDAIVSSVMAKKK